MHVEAADTVRDAAGVVHGLHPALDYGLDGDLGDVLSDAGEATRVVRNICHLVIARIPTKWLHNFSYSVCHYKC